MINGNILVEFNNAAGMVMINLGAYHTILYHYIKVNTN